MSLLTRLPAESLRLISLHLGRRVETCLYSTTTPSQVDKKAYSHTLKLPKTSFPLKHKNPVEVEARLRKKISDDLYKWQVSGHFVSAMIVVDDLERAQSRASICLSRWTSLRERQSAYGYARVCQRALMIRSCIEQDTERLHQSLKGTPRSQSPVSKTVRS